MALAYVVRDRFLQRWVSTAAAYTKEGSRTVAYLSAEFLMGPHLGNNLVNLEIYGQVEQVIAELGLDLSELLRQEEEPGLGNGGLGRLAACFLDSLATLEIPTLGYPAIAVAELMRLLVDENGVAWDESWAITRKTFAYTNHTLLPEALEHWPIGLFAKLLPHHLDIIYEINARFLDEARIHFLNNEGCISRMSLIDEAGQRYVRMANLACVGSHAMNGVAALHTQLLQQDVLRDCYALSPQKFSNKTNGRDAAALHAVEQPETARPHLGLYRRSLGDRARRAAPARSADGRRGVSRGVACKPTREQGGQCR